MNSQAFLTVADAIEKAEGKHFTMSRTLAKAQVTYQLPQDHPMCRSIGCIMGWTVATHRKIQPLPYNDDGNFRRASQFLGITSNQATRLFYGVDDDVLNGVWGKTPYKDIGYQDVVYVLRAVAEGQFDLDKDVMHQE